MFVSLSEHQEDVRTPGGHGTSQIRTDKPWHRARAPQEPIPAGAPATPALSPYLSIRNFTFLPQEGSEGARPPSHTDSSPLHHPRPAGGPHWLPAPLLTGRRGRLARGAGALVGWRGGLGRGRGAGWLTRRAGARALIGRGRRAVMAGMVGYVRIGAAASAPLVGLGTWKVRRAPRRPCCVTGEHLRSPHRHLSCPFSL